MLENIQSMPSYTVYASSLRRRNENEKGVSLDYSNNRVQSFRDKDQAINFARRFRLQQGDAIYVCDDTGTVFSLVDGRERRY
ncbi:hypothetical protein LCGC14_1579750 [marine sediment metagenome]|uniref:Uncharacterized protein n=1 Tax=marine sediment metagenome TaxID=412755 RepID=A0A0F9J3C3_9ZZZZ